ncbi:MAG: hypothetical protein EXS03_08560 [Phycisphaerales bacterium]|nr:hypothetical protein [Phycisphaerales bacterium]
MGKQSTNSSGLKATSGAPSIEKPVTTQRAYTLRLRGIEGDKTWRDSLWATHEAINLGAKAFGDWLLTLRGGLEHTLADATVAGGKGKPARPPSADERRDRRVLLALSWLTVEDERGAPKAPGLIVAYGDDCKSAKDSQDGRDRKVEDALRDILIKRSVAPGAVESWVNDCVVSLKARIRDDAVWVNRSAAFDALRASWRGLTCPNARTVLEQFFGPVADWITLPARAADDGEGDTGGPTAAGSSNDTEFKLVARSFLSENFGTGLKSSKSDISDALMQATRSLAALRGGSPGSAVWSHLCTEFGLLAADDEARAKALRVRIGWTSGRRSKGRLALATAASKASLAQVDIELLIKKLSEEAQEKLAGSTKLPLPWVNDLMAALERSIGFGFVTERNLIDEFGVMLDHAARRVSIACSWIKLAELERRQFEEDAKKLDQVRTQHADAAAFLDTLGCRRGSESGSAGGASVVIRKRAVLGWNEVVGDWARQGCKSVQERIDAARLLQGELEKFGDIRLFEELAANDAQVVWQNAEGETDPTILARYSAGSVAKANQQRFKVPAYRHPDPLRHPVFGDFGKSRWKIDFAVHESDRAQSGGKRVRSLDAAWQSDVRNMRMALWTGKRVEMVPLRWSSKRLSKDLGISDLSLKDPTVVTRGDRLGRAAVGPGDPVRVASVFAEDNWNGRLQAPRVELNRVARLTQSGNLVQARRLRDRLSWLVSFSPKLAPSGPFIDYAAAHGIEPHKKSGEYWPNSAMNKERKGHHSKLIYSRLPSLRVLSVDLGHRFAAACAVWESMSAAQMRLAASKGKVVRGGIAEGALFIHIESTVADGTVRTTVYRRIGEDALPDGSPHPAPWAKLERQFLIKLQGEETPSRMAALDELVMIADWERALGYQPVTASSTKQSNGVAGLMGRTVRLFMHASRRHFDRARIAHNLTAEHRTKPGGVPESLTEETRIELLIDTLALWHGLFAGDRWRDPRAQKEWETSGLPSLKLPGRGDDDETAFGGPGRKAAMVVYRNELKPHAERMAHSDLSNLSKCWTDRWAQDDREWTAKSGRLRSLRRWITPRGLRPVSGDSAQLIERKAAAALRARHVGGLSMQRINTLTDLYRLLKSFKNRPEPSNLRKNIPEKGDARLIGFNQRLLDVRDRLREQRVKQLASRIVEAALGIGRIKIRRVAAGSPRPTLRVDAACHAVVTENLSNYQPAELQTRRENRQLMAWASSKVHKYLAESCQLHGLHLREVQPNYTSRQCSRTGAAGLRGVAVSATDLLTNPWWMRDVAQAKARIEKALKNGRNGAVADQLLVSAEAWALRIPERDRHDRKADESVKAFHAERVILPRKGGDLFVAESARCNGKGHVPALQADLNAAANVGIRALLDPDWPGKWWWVPCVGGTYSPSPEKTSGAKVLEHIDQLPHEMVDPPQVAPKSSAPQPKSSRAAKVKAKEFRAIENRWRTCSSELLSQGKWIPSGEYWSKVEAAVCLVLNDQIT